MVDPAIIAAGISTAGSLAGRGLSMVGGSSGYDYYPYATQAQNWRNDDMAWAREQFDRNEALQREFAQNGIQWKAADARAAGLHPLAVLGGQGYSAAPISVGGAGSYDTRSSHGAAGNHNAALWGGALADMGQNLSRAFLASQPKEEKVFTAFELARQAQQLEHGNLQNEYIRLQIANASRPGIGNPNAGIQSPWSAGGVGGVPSPDSGNYDPKPYEVTTANPKDPSSGAGPPQPEREWRATGNGSVANYPAAGLNIDEIGSPGYVGWMWRNGVLPFLDKNTTTRPPDSMLPRGANGWVHHFGEWYPTYPSKDFKHLPPMRYPYAGTRYGSLPPVYERD